ncbi:cell division protein FtsL [Methylolobus aquaticus]|uniref:cell division protein FtsL n=1 Tax=Methylotetracoccus oryzae TaxID=1919059 RepID=UPI00102288CC|nr:cell division protein FtsL [Methylotetracoccus oryzae]RYU63012.1 cell division protein FtsL [Methylolobus aquaticus]
MKVVAILIAVLVASALGVIYAKYRSRMLFTEVQRLEQSLEAYDVELGQLQLEQNTWAEHSRIEKLAHTRLGMILPSRESIIYLHVGQ